SENVQGQEIAKINQILLFKENTGLSIEYDENKNDFQFNQILVCNDVAQLYKYAYVCINDTILFFGGCSWDFSVMSKLLYKYEVRENKWMVLQNTLPIQLYDCYVILNEEDNDINIIGGLSSFLIQSNHIKAKVMVCDP
ncbi:hypothetical protein RFI_36419, partial [Reticulomyxa filosa]